MITLYFSCGHPPLQCEAVALSDRPACPTCGQTGVTHVEAPRPTFRGTCAGPLTVPDSSH